MNECQEVVSVDISSNDLQIICDSARVLISARHRLFFTSVLGFKQESESFVGYRKAFDGTSGRILDEVLLYLKSISISWDLGSAASSLLNARKTSGQALEFAKSAGEKVQQTDLFDQPSIPGFLRILKPYQLPAVAHMCSVAHSANFSVPGSGKTTMVLAAYAQIKESSNIEKLLIVGPRSCFSPWEEEFLGCFGRSPNCVRLSGTPTERFNRYETANNSDVELVLVTYQTASNDSGKLLEFLKRFRTMLVLDESHYIKRLNGGVWAKSLLDLAPFAAKRVVLSGTPVPNGIEDIWSQMTFLWPEPPLLGGREQFQDRVNRGGTGITEEIRDELSPLFWRVKKSDVALPPPEYHRIPVKMRPYQTTIYQALAAKVLSDIESRPSEREKLRQWRKAKMVRLLQAASNPTLLSEYSPEFKIPPLNAQGLSISQIIENYSQFEVPAKIDFTVQLVESILQKEPLAKVVVWSAFVHNLKTLDIALKNWQPRVIHGSIPKDASEDAEFNREQLIHDFKTDSRYRVMLANPGACAESISLHKICKHAVYMDRSFNGAQYMQSLDRIHRLGLDPSDKIHYYLLSAENTVDEVVDARLEEKHAKLIRLLEGDLATIDFDVDDVTEEADEVGDFEAIVLQLREQFDSRSSL